MVLYWQINACTSNTLCFNRRRKVIFHKNKQNNLHKMLAEYRCFLLKYKYR